MVPSCAIVRFPRFFVSRVFVPREFSVGRLCYNNLNYTVQPLRCSKGSGGQTTDMKKTKSRKQKLCIECKKCCRYVGVYTHPDFYDCSLEEVRKFYEMRGFTVQKDSGAILLTIPFPCPHLAPDGCDIYEKRPLACRKYNGMEDFGHECLWSRLKE